jgi:LysM repeat protein
MLRWSSLLPLLALAPLLVFQGGCRTRDYDGTRSAVPVTQQIGIDYRVEPGDTLSSIAAAYQISIKAIVDANQLTTNNLNPGRMLRLPGAVAKPVAPPEPEGPRSDWYVPRAKWAEEAIRVDRIDPMNVKPYRITVHHSADLGMSMLDAVACLREIEREHMAGAGKNALFACIGYHFIIGDDGTVYEGRPLKYQGAHATGTNNIGNIGVCLLGDFDKHAPSAAQQAKLIAVLDRLRADYGIRLSPETVFCHKDFKPTNCPGAYLEPLVRAYAEGRLRH